MSLAILGRFLAGTRGNRKNLPPGRNIGSVENRIQKYLDYLDLGGDLYEADNRKVSHKTIITQRTPKGELIITHIQEDIEFS